MKERVFKIEFSNGAAPVEIKVIEHRYTHIWIEAAGRADTLGPVRSITLADEPEIDPRDFEGVMKFSAEENGDTGASKEFPSAAPRFLTP